MNAPSRLTLVALLLWSLAAWAAPSQTVPRNWACPKGWVTSGGNCLPNPSVGQVPQRGACPSGYEAVGAYCYPLPRRGLVIPEAGARPPRESKDTEKK